jgi:hypothetical protein
MIYAKTALGLAAMQDRSAGLTPRQRSAFIMFDGKRDASDVLKMTAGVGVTQIDLDHLVSLGLLASTGPATAAKQSAPEPSDSEAPATSEVASIKASGMPTLSAQAHYSMAYPIATRLTAALGLRGFRLNLAVEAAGDLEKLKELAPKIKDAVGADKYKELDDALNF